MIVTAQVGTGSRGASGAGLGRTILIVEDEGVVRRVVARVLRRQNYQVIEAGSAEEAWPTLDRCSPDLVITDLDLPGASGEILARELQQSHPRVPLLVMTGWHDRARQIAERGAERIATLSKPFNGQDLVAAVQRALPAPSAS